MPSPRACLCFLMTAPALLSLFACQEEDAASLPDVTGDYTVRYGATNPGIGGDCDQVDDTLAPAAFSSWIGSTLDEATPPIGTLTLEQEGTQVDFDFQGCDFVGNVNTDGEFYFTGSCQDPDSGADLDVEGVGIIEIQSSSYKKILAGDLTMEVDFLDGEEMPGADGTPDCTRTGTLDAEASTL